MSRKTVSIFGGGLSGLTVAHELSDYMDVTLYEKDVVFGGMAKSKRNNMIPSEHSWRGFAPFYYNTYDILNKIPISSPCSLSSKSSSNKPLPDKQQTSARPNLQEDYTNNSSMLSSMLSSIPSSINITSINKSSINKTSTNKSSLPVYTLEEVTKATTDDKLWCYHKQSVYDLTNYLDKHPGGAVFLRKAGGKDIVTVWKQEGVEWHTSHKSILDYLETMKIGTLAPNPGAEMFSTKSTVYDRLVPIDFDLLFNTPKPPQYGETLGWKDRMIISYLFAKVLTSDHRLSDYFSKRLDPFLKKHMSPQGYHYLSDYIAGPGYGFDKNTMSIAHYAIFSKFNYDEQFKRWNVLNQPTNEAWIDPWVSFLQSKGVTLKNQQTLTTIHVTNNSISHCIVNNKKITSDYYVFCINPFDFETILKNSQLPYKLYQNLNTPNTQISFRIGISKPLRFHTSSTVAKGFVLIDSPYNITFYSQTDTWCDSSFSHNKIKTLLSGTIIRPYHKGSLYNKKASSLTISELSDEIVHQFLESQEFINYVQTHNNQYTLTKDDIVYVEIYDDWYYDPKIKFLQTKNKKWVNNTLNESYRPTQQMNYPNGFIGGGHSVTSVNIWSMESSVESGKRVAQIILNPLGHSVYYYDHSQQSLLRSLLQTLDNLCYAIRLPPLFDTCLIIIGLLIGWAIYRFIRMKNL